MGEGLENLPYQIKENSMRDIAQEAYQAGSDFLIETSLGSNCLYNENKDFQGQLRDAVASPNSLAGQIVNRLLWPKEQEDPNTAWEKQWMTVFAVFNALGESRARGDGNGRGSDDLRFAARVLQAHLIETQDPKVKVEGARDVKDNQARLLRGTARFALAAAEYTAGDSAGGDYLQRDSLVRIFEQAFLNKDTIVSKVAEDLKKPEDEKDFSIRNI